jgi:hypothetical protein
METKIIKRAAERAIWRPRFAAGINLGSKDRDRKSRKSNERQDIKRREGRKGKGGNLWLPKVEDVLIDASDIVINIDQIMRLESFPTG